MISSGVASAFLSIGRAAAHRVYLKVPASQASPICNCSNPYVSAARTISDNGYRKLMSASVAFIPPMIFHNYFLASIPLSPYHSLPLQGSVANQMFFGTVWWELSPHMELAVTVVLPA